MLLHIYKYYNLKTFLVKNEKDINFINKKQKNILNFFNF